MSLSQSCTCAIRWGIPALLVFAPVAFGGDHIVPLACIELATLVMLILWAVGAASEGELRVLKTPLVLPLLAFVALVVVQLALSHPVTIERWRGREATAQAVLDEAYVESAGESTAALLALAQALGTGEDLRDGNTASPRGWLPEWASHLRRPPLVGSVYFHGTLTYFCRLLTYVVIFFLVTHAFRTEHELSRLVAVLILVGLGEALYGFFQYLSGMNMLLWIKKKYFLDAVTGTYVNRNHFAGFMELVLPMVFASALFVRARSRFSRRRPLVGRAGIRGKIAALAGQASSRALLLYFVFIIMAVALVFSRSRGGMTAFLFSLIFLVLLLAWRRAARGAAVLIGGILVLVVVVGLWVGMQSVVERFYYTYEQVAKGVTSTQRVSVWKDTLSIAAQYPVLGSGLGTYQYVFPRYQTTSHHLFFDHAHNDYLEVFTDTGVIGFALVAWCVVGFFGFLGVCRRQGASKGYDSFAAEPRAPFFYLVGGSAGVTALLVHSIFDFNLHIPANALTFAVIAGVVAVSWKLSRSPSPASWVVPLPTVTARIALLLVACLLGVAVGKAVISAYVDSREVPRLTALAEAPRAGPQPEGVQPPEVRSYDADLWYASARYALARYQGRQGRFEKPGVRGGFLDVARRRAEVAAFLNPVVSRYYLLAGWASYLHGTALQAEGAEEAPPVGQLRVEDERFRRAIVFGPYDTGVLHSVGTYLLARGHKEPAIALYARANSVTRVDLSDSQLDKTLRSLFRHTKQYSDLQAIVPTDEAAARAVFAEFLLEKRLFDEAVREREVAAALFVTEGDEEFREGRYEKAAHTYAHARQLDGGNMQSLTGLARSQAKLGWVSRALETLGEFFREMDGETDALSDALTTLEEMAAVHLYDPNVHLLLGFARERVGQGPGAVEALRRALSLEPRFNKNAQLHAVLGRALRGSGVLDGAAEELELAVSLEHDDSALWQELAAVYREQGAVEAAAGAEATAKGLFTTTIGQDQWPNGGLLAGGAPLTVRINTRAGPVRFSLQARGTSANRVDPYLLIRLDNQVIWCGAVGAHTWSTYEFAAETLAGTHRFSVEFLNDYQGERENRSAVLGDMEISCDDS